MKGMIIMTAKTPTAAAAKKMAVAFLESASYKDEEMDRSLVNLIRNRCVKFTAPDMFEITERGMNEVESKLNG